MVANNFRDFCFQKKDVSKNLINFGLLLMSFAIFSNKHTAPHVFKFVKKSVWSAEFHWNIETPLRIVPWDIETHLGIVPWVLKTI